MFLDQPVLKWLLGILMGTDSLNHVLVNYPLIGAILISFACVIVCMTISFVFKFILELIK